MTYSVLETAAAARDLDNIFNYIAMELNNLPAAKELADEVGQCYEKLSVAPFMYELCHDKRLNELGYRKVVIKNYVMVYRINNAEHIVYILRFFYGRRNYAVLL